ncbi:MAG TPA: hypothetical protein VLD57_09895 [Blastocatellia bacterium]|nr:hypothetical protein [Blastocatellia bacterium]
MRFRLTPSFRSHPFADLSIHYWLSQASTRVRFLITSGLTFCHEPSQQGIANGMQPIRIEIKGKTAFWTRAFHVEWQYQFPDREMTDAGDGCFLISPAWLADVERVAGQCFCEALRPPDNPQRRRWLGSLVRQRDN